MMMMITPLQNKEEWQILRKIVIHLQQCHHHDNDILIMSLVELVQAVSFLQNALSTPSMTSLVLDRVLPHYWKPYIIMMMIRIIIIPLVRRFAFGILQMGRWIVSKIEVRTRSPADVAQGIHVDHHDYIQVDTVLLVRTTATLIVVGGGGGGGFVVAAVPVGCLCGIAVVLSNVS
jgi:H+/Cl- antiporter ClcA